MNTEFSELAIVKQLKLELSEKNKEIQLKNEKLANVKNQLRECLDALKKRNQSNKDLRTLRNKYCISRLIELENRIRIDNSDEETGEMPLSIDTGCLFELINSMIKEEERNANRRKNN